MKAVKVTGIMYWFRLIYSCVVLFAARECCTVFEFQLGEYLAHVLRNWSAPTPNLALLKWVRFVDIENGLLQIYFPPLLIKGEKPLESSLPYKIMRN